MDQHDDHSPHAAEPTVKESCSARFDRQGPDQQELTKILTSLKLDPWGIVSLGTDGVLRSLTADRDVVDAAGLSPRLFKAFMDRMPPGAKPDSVDEADGTKVPREQWFHPDKSLLPPPMTDEQKERTRKRDEEMSKERVDQRSQE